VDFKCLLVMVLIINWKRATDGSEKRAASTFSVQVLFGFCGKNLLQDVSKC
jgi:hypothetical protein